MKSHVIRTTMRPQKPTIFYFDSDYTRGISENITILTPFIRFHKTILPPSKKYEWGYYTLTGFHKSFKKAKQKVEEYIDVVKPSNFWR